MKISTIILLVLIVLANIYFIFYAPLPIQINCNCNPILQTPTIQGTQIIIKGYSPYDPYDRILNVMYNNIEVLRIITPLHRDGSLPNFFQWTVTLPFNATGGNFTVREWDIQNLWDTTIYTYTIAGSYHIESLVPLGAYMVGQLQPITFKINILHQNETIYIIASGHDLLESVPDIQFKVDNTTYTVFDWHPLSNDVTLTSTGYIIPYIAVNLSVGVHTITLIGSPEYPNPTPYLLFSAFGVWPIQQG